MCPTGVWPTDDLLSGLLNFLVVDGLLAKLFPDAHTRDVTDAPCSGVTFVVTSELIGGVPADIAFNIKQIVVTAAVVGLLGLYIWQHLRLYQDRYQFVTAHTWELYYSAGPLGDQGTGTITCCPTQSHYPDVEPISPCLILIMLSN